MKIGFLPEISVNEIQDPQAIADSLNSLSRTINAINSKRLSLEDNIKCALYTFTVMQSINVNTPNRYIRLPNKYPDRPQAVVVAAAKPLVPTDSFAMREYYPFVVWDLDSGNNIVVTHVNLLIDYGTVTVPTEFTLLALY